MATPACRKCLARPSMPSWPFNPPNQSSSRTPFVMSFSSTTTRAGGVPVLRRKKVFDTKASSVKSLRLKNKAPVKTGKPPAPGERKAIRKRIVLSNSNALEVPTMVDMTAELDKVQIGSVVGIPGVIVDQLRAVEAFKTTQGWALFKRPAMLIREESVEIAEMLRKNQEAQSTSRMIVDGERGTGKSMMVLQAMATAFIRGWVVLNIPEAQDLTNAHTAYSPISGTNPVLYSQITYTATWLGQIAKANNAVLSALPLLHQHTLSTPLPPNISLARLAELGSRDPDIAYSVFLALWKELTSPARPPLLLCLDGLHHIMNASAYRNAAFERIHAHDLALIAHFVAHLSCTAPPLPNGGAVIAATSKGNSPLSYATDLAIRQALARQVGKDGELEVEKADPWKKIDTRAYESLSAASVLKLKGLSKVEARGLMEYWAASGLLRQRVDERSVAEKWALAGNGVVGEIERGALRMSI